MERSSPLCPPQFTLREPCRGSPSAGFYLARTLSQSETPESSTQRSEVRLKPFASPKRRTLASGKICNFPTHLELFSNVVLMELGMGDEVRKAAHAAWTVYLARLRHRTFTASAHAFPLRR